MGMSRREFVQARSVERHRAHPFAPGVRRGTKICGARDAAGAPGLEPGRHRGRPYRRRRQGHGSKLYAADFRAADLPGWPAKTSHAMLIRATDATHVYTGLDLSRLTGALKPSVVVTADDFARIGARVPEYYAQGDLFCPLGKTPLYLGQPIALLIFEDFDTFDQARLALRDGATAKYGEETGPIVRAPYFGLSLYSRGRPDPGFAGCLLAGQERLGQPGQVPGHRAPDLDAAPHSQRAGLCGSRGLWRGDSRRARGGQSGASGARPPIRNRVERPAVSRAGKRPRLVRPRPQEPRARDRRAVAA